LSKNSNLTASPVDLGALLESSGAILRGHFILTSGRHSAVYFEKFRVLERPEVLSALASQLVSELPSGSVDLVAGPTTGGIIIAFEVARQLGVPSLYVESEDGQRKLRRGAKVPPGARILVVDDVLTTGKSVREVNTLLKEQGGEVVGVGVLIDRSGGAVDFGVPLVRAYEVQAESFAPDEVPEWLARIPAVKPGTRSS